MQKTKRYCETHHLYYNGSACPICESERVERMVKKYTNTIPKEPVQASREATIEDINKLINKFKNR